MEQEKGTTVNQLVLCTNSLHLDMLCPDLCENFGYTDELLEAHPKDFCFGICVDETTQRGKLIPDAHDVISMHCPVILLGDKFADKAIISQLAKAPDTGLLYHSLTDGQIIAPFHNKKESQHDRKGLYLSILQVIEHGNSLTTSDIALILERYNAW